jgi:hypothetical protein
VISPIPPLRFNIFSIAFGALELPFGCRRRAGRQSAAAGIARHRLEGSRNCPLACMQPHHLI